MKNSAAIVILNEKSINLAQQIQEGLNDCLIYGLNQRVSSADIYFDNFGETVRELFNQGKPIIGICAAGILIRTIAPLLADKRSEPPLIAVAEDGTAIVPLLGGLAGVNDWSRKIGDILNINPSITTTGNLRFNVTLEDPPTGYKLAHPDRAKTFTSDLIAGKKVRLEGEANWLINSTLPWDDRGEYLIKITDQIQPEQANQLIYHPSTLLITIAEAIEPEIALSTLEQLLTTKQLAKQSIAGIITLPEIANHPHINNLASSLNIPLRWSTNLNLNVGQVIANNQNISVIQNKTPIDINKIGNQRGKLSVIGTGPGSTEWMSPQVKEILHNASDLVGYSTYLNLVKPFHLGKEIHISDNRQEIDRAQMALQLAVTGRNVVVVSSGDPGIYAMASAVFEALETHFVPEYATVEINIAPGISAMQAAAAKIGAPLGHDFCVISLSDILKPWSAIANRIKAALSADLVIAFYNPISSQRTWQLPTAIDILKQYRSPQTPVILGRNLGRKGETVRVIKLEEFTPEQADMRTVIIIGSSQTRYIDLIAGQTWVYTPRTYSAV